eukprot:scaffold154377_cov53-Attheya_sp.AAC.1
MAATVSSSGFVGEFFHERPERRQRPDRPFVRNNEERRRTHWNIPPLAEHAGNTNALLSHSKDASLPRHGGEQQKQDDPLMGVVKPFARHVVSSSSSSHDSDDVPVVLFTSWHDLLFCQETRSHTLCGDIPPFVEFCFQHQSIATQWNQYNNNNIHTTTTNHPNPNATNTNHPDVNKNGETTKKENVVVVDDLSMDHVPNLLQGGAATGPIVRTQAGQVVRQLAYYPNNLTALPRHSLSHPSIFRHDSLSWVTELQETWLPAIQAEWSQFMTSSSDEDDDMDMDDLWQSLRTRRGKEWSDETGWAHIALVDNFQCNEETARRWFPETVRILWDVVGTHRRIGPRLVALARQTAHSGIPPHVDYMNWMLTLHIPIAHGTNTNNIIGTRTNAGMRVNGVAHEWIIGHAVVMDTSFPHETYNDSDQDVYLLMIDFWHPDLSLDELDALRCFFAANSGV